MARPSARSLTHNFVLEAHPYCDTAAAYAAGDVIGAKMELRGLISGDYGGSVLSSIHLVDKSGQNASVDLLIFDQDLASTITNNAVAAIAADMPNLIAAVTFSSDNYEVISTGTVPTVVSRAALDIPLQGDGSESLYGLLISRGTPTYTDTDALILRIGVQKDG